MRYLFVLFALLVFIPTEAQAVPNANAINWTGSPTAFAASLYTGVLGRTAESPAAVAGWAAQVTSSPTSRLAVFHKFVNSPEYRGRYRNGVRGRYYTWTNNCPKSAYNRFTVATRAPRGSWTTSGAGVSWGYAMAIRNYKQAYVPYRYCR